MKRGSQIAPLLLAALLAGGCYKATFVRDVPAFGPVQDEWRSFWLFGTLGEQQVDVRQFCPDGNVRWVRTGGNFGTGLLTALTIGIWAPRKVYVQCGKRESAVGRSQIDRAVIAISEAGRPIEMVIRDTRGNETTNPILAGRHPGEWRVAIGRSGGEVR